MVSQPIALSSSLSFPLQAYPSGREDCPQALKVGASLGPPIAPYLCASEKNGTNEIDTSMLGWGGKDGTDKGNPHPRIRTPDLSLATVGLPGKRGVFQAKCHPPWSIRFPCFRFPRGCPLLSFTFVLRGGNAIPLLVLRARALPRTPRPLQLFECLLGGMAALAPSQAGLMGRRARRGGAAELTAPGAATSVVSGQAGRPS